VESIANTTRDFLRPFIIRESSVDELCRVVAALSEDVRSQMLGEFIVWRLECIECCILNVSVVCYSWWFVYYKNVCDRKKTLRLWSMNCTHKHTSLHIASYYAHITCFIPYSAMPVPGALLKLLLNGLDGTVNDAKERLSYW